MNQMEYEKLKVLTEQLLDLNQEAEHYYINFVKKEGYEVDFYGRVKPFVDKVTHIKTEWLPLAIRFVQENRPLHLHPIQLNQTEENLEIVAIKSFYADTGLKRQHETFKSVEYVLQQVLNALNTK
ncbi:YppE family protein [Bacillus solitudinis]|uniref:YppE family protein n=1 Tax=Bacillus solitudinis TaxID=2014074 RepID=UPI000C236CEF|nr:YppE family protein [Bacillus solitudinis]